MPVVGLFLGRALGAVIGGVADYVAAAALVALGLYLLLSDQSDEGARVAALSARRGAALIALGISISLDELAIGFTIGLLQLSIWLAVVLIGAQAFLLAQIGLRLGARLGEAAGEWAERLAGIALVALGLLVAAEQQWGFTVA